MVGMGTSGKWNSAGKMTDFHSRQVHISRWCWAWLSSKENNLLLALQWLFVSIQQVLYTHYSLLDGQVLLQSHSINVCTFVWYYILILPTTIPNFQRKVCQRLFDYRICPCTLQKGGATGVSLLINSSLTPDIYPLSLRVENVDIPCGILLWGVCVDAAWKF